MIHFSGDEDIIPLGMSNDCISQSWYRFLNTIGNPVNLTKPEVISQTQKFLQYALSSEGVLDPCQHPSLQVLPLIFLKAMKGIAGQVDAFLGISELYYIIITSSTNEFIPVSSSYVSKNSNIFVVLLYFNNVCVEYYLFWCRYCTANKLGLCCDGRWSRQEQGYWRCIYTFHTLSHTSHSTQAS